MSMKLINGDWTDESNNTWCSGITTEAQAVKYSASLINCSGCSDCSDCSGCSDCSDCCRCSDCRDCVDCADWKII